MIKYHVGDEVKAKIVGIQPYGAFAQISPTLTGLIHISEISESFVRDVSDYFALGDNVDAIIIEIDEANNHAKLSIKRLAKNAKRYRQVATKRKPYKCDKMYNFDEVNDFNNEKLEEELNKDSNVYVRFHNDYCDDKVNYDEYKDKIKEIHDGMHNKTLVGSEYLGWLDLPINYNEKELLNIVNMAEEFRNKFDTLVVCGVGGSYLGAIAAIKALNGVHSSDSMHIIYLGNTFSPTYTSQLLKFLETRNFAVNVISKSGTTAETSIAFRFLRELLTKKYGKEGAKERIVETTDKNSILKDIAKVEGYQTFNVPSDIGGRYSVFTPVGLFPMACANINIFDILLGAKKAYNDLNNDDINTNPAYQYALNRYHLYNKGYKAEMFINYDPQNIMLSEWLKQLFGESEGKDGKGLLPTSACFSTDLHSLGQFIQSGSKNVLFETELKPRRNVYDLEIKKETKDYDGLNHLAGKTLGYINSKMEEAVMNAHYKEAKVPNLILEYNEMDAKNLGYLMYFMELACAMSAYLLGVNPFDQPGVEYYKKNMIKLLDI